MCQVNMYQAKTDFSRLVAMLENGSEDEIIIARNGVPVARLALFKNQQNKKRFGAAKKLLKLPLNFDSEFDSLDSEVQEMFGL